MAAGTRTFGIGETLIDPGVLPPPPTRHALLAFLVTLAAILHIGTAPWSDVHNGAEGYYASAALEMTRSDVAPPHDPPLVQWLIAGSYKLFGVTAAAVRLPTAAAMISSVALTFLIGDQLAGYWRGFSAGLLHLCCLGPAIWGRIATAETIFAATLEAVIFCATCGYQQQQKRSIWFAGVWLFAALGFLTKGITALVYPAAIFCFLALPYREVRVRFRLLLHWPGPLLFLALVLPWLVWIKLHEQVAFSEIALRWLVPFASGNVPKANGIPLSGFLLAHGTWWFPAILLVLPGVCFASRKVFRPHEFDFADALPLCWIAVGFLPLLFLPSRLEYHSMSMWGGFALWTASAWDRTPRALRLAGIGLVFTAGLTLGSSATAGYTLALPPLTASEWVGLRPMVMLMALSITVSCAVAAYVVWRQREVLGLALVLLGMVPVGLITAEEIARSGAQFSLANAAELVQPDLGKTGEVLYEGSPLRGSSLGFYLARRVSLVSENQQAAAPGFNVGAIPPAAAVEKMAESHPVFLIIGKNRTRYWQEQLTARFHLYHQVTTCGPHVVLSNLP